MKPRPRRVIPAHAGIQAIEFHLDSGVRQNDGWRMVQKDLPSLRVAVSNMLAELESAERQG